jgi:hypothetical protein
MRAMTRYYIHPGFARSGTTTLQRNVFSKLHGFQAASNETPEFGGLLAYVRSLDQVEFDLEQCLALRDTLLSGAGGDGEGFILSDEMLTEPALLFHQPVLVEQTLVAERLARLFPGARVMFSIRNQYDYVTSKFNMLRSNSALFAGVDIGTFQGWMDGQMGQYRSYHLLNLNYLKAVKVYQRVFGADNVFVTPLERLQGSGKSDYIHTLAQWLELQPDRIPAGAFDAIENKSTSGAEYEALGVVAGLNRMALSPEQRRALVDAVRRVIPDRGPDRGPDSGPDSATSGPVLTPAQKAHIHAACADGNTVLAAEFGLDLQKYGYP